VVIAFTVNDTPQTITAPETAILLDVLRNQLGLMGTRYGCGLEQAAAAWFWSDGQPIDACTREVGAGAGKRVTTIEGLGTVAKLQAWTGGRQQLARDALTDQRPTTSKTDDSMAVG
jgi:nicotinate dehydrogenase subunit A